MTQVDDGTRHGPDEHPIRRLCRRLRHPTLGRVRYAHARIERLREDVERDHSQVTYLELMTLDDHERLDGFKATLAEIAQTPDSAALAEIRAELRAIRAQAVEHYEQNELHLDEFRQLLADLSESMGRVSQAARRFSDKLGD